MTTLLLTKILILIQLQGMSITTDINEYQGMSITTDINEYQGMSITIDQANQYLNDDAAVIETVTTESNLWNT